MKEAVRAPGSVRTIERCAVPDRNQDVLESVSLRSVIVDVSSRDDTESHTAGEPGERFVSGSISLDPIVLKLDEYVAGSERRNESCRHRFRVRC